MAMAENEQKPRQACDNCRCRKIRCDRGSPCNHCVSADLQCRYLHVKRRTGPKKGSGRRLSQLRLGLTEIDKNFINVSTPSKPSRLVSVNNGANDDRAKSQTPSSQFCPSPDDALQNVTAGTDSLAHATSSLDVSLLDATDQTQQLSLSLVAHIQAFLKYIFPIMPVIDGNDTLTDAMRLNELTPSRYALVISLCAATRAHLKLDSVENNTGDAPGANIPAEPQITAGLLITMAETSLRQYNVIDDYSLDTVLSSFFLFAAYGNLDNARHAWFYLNQSISLAQALDITSESGYANLPESEREVRRRIFWLLFVTERTFALQHRRSVMIRSRIAKPRIVDTDCPTVMHDFVNHVRLFDLLPCSLYEWHSEDETCQVESLSLTNDIHAKLCALQPETSLIESQRFDTLISQQWLRVSMWRLAFGKKPSTAYNRDLPMPLGIPFDAGKVVMSALSSFGQVSKNCHGIGMEQKLFDIGVSLADTALLPALCQPAWEVGPRDLLCAVIKHLAKVRGCQSHLLPPLLKHAETALGFTNPASHLDMQWNFYNNSTNFATDDDATVEDISDQAGESMGASNWAITDDFGLIVPEVSYTPESFIE